MSSARQIAYTASAVKALRRMDGKMAQRVRAKVQQYAADPAAQANNVKALQGVEGVLRLRVGDYRVLFTDDLVVLTVLKVGHRGSVYE